MKAKKRRKHPCRFCPPARRVVIADQAAYVGNPSGIAFCGDHLLTYYFGQQYTGA